MSAQNQHLVGRRVVVSGVSVGRGKAGKESCVHQLPDCRQLAGYPDEGAGRHFMYSPLALLYILTSGFIFQSDL